jgi:isopentenyl phosphate kinase
MILLKLGGSLITDKSKPETPKPLVITRLAQEIYHARQKQPDLKLVVGHGSGSFGHPVAAKYGTHLGASSPSDWLGFVKVWMAQQRLNRLIIDVFAEAGLPVIGFPPSTSAITHEGTILEMALKPIKRSLEAGLLPLVYGDVAFDNLRGSSIVSTEKVFAYIARRLLPRRVLLAGLEPGVYESYPDTDKILSVITENDLANITLKRTATPDVTGGMDSKVHEALAIARALPDLEVRIFSGEEPGVIESALLGDAPGTLISPES